MDGFFVGTVERSLGRHSDLEYWMMVIIIVILLCVNIKLDFPSILFLPLITIYYSALEFSEVYQFFFPYFSCPNYFLLDHRLLSTYRN